MQHIKVILQCIMHIYYAHKYTVHVLMILFLPSKHFKVYTCMYVLPSPPCICLILALGGVLNLTAEGPLHVGTDGVQH